jgi:hypothetical protein
VCVTLIVPGPFGAMIDKKTGKVWIWTNITDNNGKKTGKTAFLSEEAIPEPEK